MVIFYQPQLLILHPGFGKVSRNVSLFLNLGACLKVSMTSNDPIWTTAWIPTLPSFKPSLKFPHNRNLPSLLISDLILPETTHWNLLALHSVFDFTSASEISKIHISTDGTPRFLWIPSCSDRFTTNSVGFFFYSLYHHMEGYLEIEFK